MNVSNIGSHGAWAIRTAHVPAHVEGRCVWASLKGGPPTSTTSASAHVHEKPIAHVKTAHVPNQQKTIIALRSRAMPDAADSPVEETMTDDPTTTTATQALPTVETAAKPSAVKLHHIPRWLRKRIHQRLGRGVDLVEAIGRTASDLPQSFWLDHWGSTKLDDGREAFVSEPYGLTTDGTRGVLRFAEACGLDVSVSRFSEWNPAGGTVRIVFLPNSED